MQVTKRCNIEAKDSRNSDLFIDLTLTHHIEGLELQAQFELADGRLLLFVTDNTPYEEGLHIYLISRQLTILDQLDIGNAYTPGMLQNLKVIDGQSCSFTFFENQAMLLNLLPSPIHMMKNPQGVSHKLGMFKPHYLKLTLLENSPIY